MTLLLRIDHIATLTDSHVDVLVFFECEDSKEVPLYREGDVVTDTVGHPFQIVLSSDMCYEGFDVPMPYELRVKPIHPTLPKTVPTGAFRKPLPFLQAEPT